MSDAVESGVPRRGWFKPVLVLSFAVNLLFLGLIAGGLWKRHNDQWRPRHIVLEMSIQKMMEELPAEKRAVGERVLEDLRGVFPESWNQVRVFRKDAVEALTADPYDEKHLMEIMANIRSLRSGSREARHKAVIEFIRDMSVAERRRFVQIYRETQRGPWKTKSGAGK